jgi:peptidoglycan/xylan/chitin deacetylase (PgdA/CDA1 family)
MGDLLILCYHAVSDTWPTEFAVSPDRLEAQLRHLLGRGYRPLTLSQALRSGGAGKTLAVTFDDAFLSVFERALPVTAKLRVPATIFVPTAYVESPTAMQWASLDRWAGTPHEDELRCMSWEQLRALVDAGWEVGSHSDTHRKLTALSDRELDTELVESKRRCEEGAQQRCETLAYPFGAYDERVMRRVRAAGYTAAVILDGQLTISPRSMVRPGRAVEMHGLLREGVYRHDSHLRLAAKTSPLARRLRASRPFRLALRSA